MLLVGGGLLAVFVSRIKWLSIGAGVLVIIVAYFDVASFGLPFIRVTESPTDDQEDRRFLAGLGDVSEQWRVYDDFEKQPLHGTFLIDGDGRVLWHDISYDPFMEPDFVLKESLRLLAQSGKPSGTNGN